MVKLVDSPSFSTDKKARQHDFSTMLFGKVGGTATFWVKDPKAKAETDTGIAFQGDVPGEIVTPYENKEHTHWQLRIDCDGDKHKESLPAPAPRSAGAARPSS